MATYGEMYDILALIAPRPVCFVNGKKDNIFPIQATEEAFQKIRRVYKLYDSEANCVLDATPMGHAWRGDVAYPFVKTHFFS
jgi:hypothetical protein